MATSGTIGSTTFTVTDMIEHAVRRCGVLPSTLSGEMQLAARKNLFLLLTDLANRGLSLFCVQKIVLGMLDKQVQFNLPTGTIDVLDALYRTKTDLEGDEISAAGYQGIDLGDGGDDSVVNVAVQFSVAGTATLVLESSDDSATWVQRGAMFPAAQTAAVGAWLSFDADFSPEARYWRLRDSSGTLLAVSTLTFSNAHYEINMGVMNRDDYAMFPNKQFSQSGDKTLQYWFDKNLTPRIWTWPASGGDTDQLVIWIQHQIEDVGTFQNTLAVPQRWYESIVFSLACRVAIELPNGQLPPGRLEYLEQKAEYHLTRAEDGESDGSAIRLMPNLGGYTR